MKPAIRALIAVCAILPAWAQATDKPEFEVASIKPSPPPDGHGRRVSCSGGPGSKDPTLFTCENMSLSNLVCQAYSIAYYQLSAPDWAMMAMFEVNARVPAGATKEQFTQMLQNLLAERFKLAVHHESKDMQKYDLVVGRNGPKFKTAGEPPAPKDGGAEWGPPHLDKDGYPALPPGSPGMAMMNGRARLYQPAMTMAMLAGNLAGQLRAPVTDATGLTGKYEISLYWVSGSMPDSESGPTVIQAVQEQLGLRLESKKGPVDVVVVDHAEKTPVEN